MGLCYKCVFQSILQNLLEQLNCKTHLGDIFWENLMMRNFLQKLEGWEKINSARGAFQRISSNFSGQLFCRVAADMMPRCQKKKNFFTSLQTPDFSFSK